MRGLEHNGAVAAGAVPYRKRDPGGNKFRARSPPGDHRKEEPVGKTEKSPGAVDMAACGDHGRFYAEKAFRRVDQNLT